MKKVSFHYQNNTLIVGVFSRWFYTETGNIDIPQKCRENLDSGSIFHRFRVQFSDIAVKMLQFCNLRESENSQF